MGFHATGTPILAIAKRIEGNDADLIGELSNIHHVPADDIKKMIDPNYIANYFIGSIEGSMKKIGFGIDWRRKFISIEPLFSRMVEWQFMRLKEKGYLTQGSHPVGWCTTKTARWASTTQSTTCSRR